MHTPFPDFHRAQVLIVGDLMLDRYWHGSTSRISPEAPVPVVLVGKHEDRPGGAANVALNVAALNAHTVLIGVTGQDEAARQLRALLEAAAITCDFLQLPGVDTITKLRVISRQQQLIRLDFEHDLRQLQFESLHTRVAQQLAAAHVLILSDYGKGTLREAAQMIALARKQNKIVLVDPKGRDFSIYRGASVITPNFSEFEAVVGPCANEQQIVEKGAALIEQLGLTALLVTRGEHGMSLLQGNKPPLHLPTHAREVFDVTGAGDTVISVLGAALAAGESLEDATALSNIAAGIVVGKLGTAAISESELRLAVKGEQEHDLGVMTEDTLLAAVADAKARGERIVLTNGCFDILHAGHVSYLEHARQLGDRLIVAVNDDASVKRLKGPQRPIVPLQQRMAVLAGLTSVDWVVPFSEDTPERLICAVLPDRLVKGGDYRPQDIAGYHCVTKNGGQVDVLHFVDGCSTSNIVARIKALPD